MEMADVPLVRRGGALDFNGVQPPFVLKNGDYFAIVMKISRNFKAS